jgi:hypothetical protein
MLAISIFYSTVHKYDAALVLKKWTVTLDVDRVIFNVCRFENRRKFWKIKKF